MTAVSQRGRARAPLGSRGAKYLLLLPVVAAFGLLFIYPMVKLLIASLHTDLIGGVSSTDYSFGNYDVLLNSVSFRASLIRTVWLSFVIMVITAALAYPIAYYLARNQGKRSQGLVYLIIIAPLVSSLVVRTLGWQILLGPHGPINNALAHLGLSRMSLLYNKFALIVGMIHIQLPLMVLPIAAALTGMDRQLEDAAHVLGAGAVTVFRRIVFPLSVPGVAAGSIIVFCLSMSAYVTPLLLGGSKDGYFMAALVTQDATQTARIGLATAASVIFLAVIMPLVLLHRIAEGRVGRYAH